MLEPLRLAIAEYEKGGLTAVEFRERIRRLAATPGGVIAIQSFLARGGAATGFVNDVLRTFLTGERTLSSDQSSGSDATLFRRVEPSPAHGSGIGEPTLHRSAVSSPTGGLEADEPTPFRPVQSRGGHSTGGLAQTVAPDAAAARGRSDTHSDMPVPGAILGGRYKLIRELGRGGMGVVFLAESTADDQRYAVKVLGAVFGDHPEALPALREEARKSLTLRHPNIVAVYPLERDGANYYLPMEYLEGKTLRELLDEEFVRGMPLQQGWSIIQGVAAALSFAHDRGFVHSDLKPSNIFITTGGTPRVLDFGIARSLRSKRQIFDTGALNALTIEYASCEMLQCEAPDFTDDVFGFGCVAYELLCGNHPFKRHSAVEARNAGMQVQPIAALSAAQNAALRRTLAFKRQDRTASIEEFLRDWTRLQVHPQFVQPTPGVRPQPPKSGRKLFPILLSVAAALVVLALGAWLGLERLSFTTDASVTEVRGGLSNPARTGANAPSRSSPVGSVSTECSDCPEMVNVPAGLFRMSSPRHEDGRRANESPQGLVTFAVPFAIGKGPVTRQQFQRYLASAHRAASGQCIDARDGRTPVTFENPGFEQTANDPAVCVNAEEARAYAQWVNRQVGQDVYRLPTEAEWEYAMRAGTSSAYFWGDSESNACRFGNFGDRSYLRKVGAAAGSQCDDGYPFTSPVGSFSPNAWGVADAVGNVRQWTLGCLREVPAKADSAAWLGCGLMSQTVRGAGFATRLGEAETRVAAREEWTLGPDSTRNDIGFRLVRSLPK